MRQSNRTKILAAAVDVVQREGVTSVTLESVAAAAGLTKGGLMYHFPTRDALLLAIHRHLAEQWEADLAETAGKAAEDATVEERLAAYARLTTRGATRADLLLALEAATHPEYHRPWTDVLARWAPPTTDAATDPQALARFIARLAADGLWTYESLSGEPLAPDLRRLVAEHIARAIAPASPDAPPALPALSAPPSPPAPSAPPSRSALPVPDAPPSPSALPAPSASPVTSASSVPSVPSAPSAPDGSA